MRGRETLIASKQNAKYCKQAEVVGQEGLEEEPAIGGIALVEVASDEGEAPYKLVPPAEPDGCADQPDVKPIHEGWTDTNPAKTYMEGKAAHRPGRKPVSESLCAFGEKAAPALALVSNALAAACLVLAIVLFISATASPIAVSAVAVRAWGTILFLMLAAILLRQSERK